MSVGRKIKASIATFKETFKRKSRLLCEKLTKQVRKRLVKMFIYGAQPYVDLRLGHYERNMR